MEYTEHAHSNRGSLDDMRPLGQTDPGRGRRAPTPVPLPASMSLDDRLMQVESGLIAWALGLARGNKTRAAKLLQIKRSTLGDRINRCRLNGYDL